MSTPPSLVEHQGGLRYWTGESIAALDENQIFVFGSNPEGRHGKGAALVAKKFGAQYGVGRGLRGQTYALVTKNLKAGFIEAATGIQYPHAGLRSVSHEQITENIQELYCFANAHPELDFLVTYQVSNNKECKNLNGYSGQDVLAMFMAAGLAPPNIIFHESYSEPINRYRTTQNVCFFYGAASPFSNFHPARIHYKDFVFCSVEQFLMYSKAKLFGDEDSASSIYSQNESPLIDSFLSGDVTRFDIVHNRELLSQWVALMAGIKKLGRKVKGYEDPVWAIKKIKIIQFALKLKFSQDPCLMAALQQTRLDKMAEASEDCEWGIGLKECEAKNIPSHKWPGNNLLGKSLEIVRLVLK